MIYTEVMQTVVLILGSLLLTVLGLNALGGWSALQSSVPSGFFSMWKPSDHPAFPWTGIVFGALWQLFGAPAAFLTGAALAIVAACLLVVYK